ncbi:MAG: recombinase family protein [Eubacterium sp.]|nr:recombinase family protein [Eubacterium sp.]
MKQYAYVRVSSKDQNPERQIAAMRELGITEKYIYVDKMSGKDFERTEYRKMLKRLKRGDLIVIKSIDRLGRNYSEILEEWRQITKVIEANIQVLDMPLLNTYIEHDNLTGVFVADMVLQILAYVAETERSFIKQRQAEGIAIAKENGVHFGAEKIELPADFEDYYELWKAGEISIRAGASELGMSKSTFFRRCKEFDEGKCFKK